MRGRNIRASDLKIGQRWISVAGIETGLRRRRLKEARIERVTAFDKEAVKNDHNVRTTIESASGDVREVIVTRGNVVTTDGRRIIWTDPLPDDDDDAMRLVEAAHLSPNGYRSTLLNVVGHDGDLTLAVVVTEEGERDEDDGEHARETMRAFRFEERHEIGATVAILTGTTTLEEGRHVHHPALELHVSDQPFDFASTNQPCGVFGSGTFAGSRNLDEADEIADARLKPSEAIVLMMPEESTLPIIVAASGVAFHRVDDAADLLCDLPGRGLWLYANAKMTCRTDHEGETDCEIGGDAIPAGTNDIARLVGSMESLKREIADLTGRAVDDDLLASLMKVEISA